jgi:hypothetical protein
MRRRQAERPDQRPAAVTHTERGASAHPRRKHMKKQIGLAMYGKAAAIAAAVPAIALIAGALPLSTVG